MISLFKFNYKLLVLFLTFILIAIVGYADYKSSEEFSFSFFYLIPISFLALQQHITLLPIIISSIFAALLWFIADNQTRIYSNFFFPIWNASIRLLIFLSIGSLLFYLKEKQKQLNLLNIELNKLNQEKNKFIGVAAHDLRNPIGGAFSLADYICSESSQLSKDDIVESVKLIKQFSLNSISIISSLLDISKIESGKIDLNKTENNYVAFIKDHITLNQILANQKNILIALDCSETEILYNFDAAHLGEVIDNLLTNAIKYSNDGSSVVVKISKKSNNQILTEVIDYGIGILEEEQNILFNYFTKTSSKPTAGELSTGLGLAISKKIVLLHSGSIGMKNNKPIGSIFYFTLPI